MKYTTGKTDFRKVTMMPYHFDSEVVFCVDLVSAYKFGCRFFQTGSYAVLCDSIIPPHCILWGTDEVKYKRYKKIDYLWVNNNPVYNPKESKEEAAGPASGDACEAEAASHAPEEPIDLTADSPEAIRLRSVKRQRSPTLTMDAVNLIGNDSMDVEPTKVSQARSR